jgi:hypothetical protein
MIAGRRNAYIATLAILFALGGVAYYSNEQSKHFTVNPPAGDDDMSSLRSATPPPAPVPPPPPAAQPTPPPPLTAVMPDSEKVETYILEVDEFTSRPQEVTVTTSKKVNLLVKADKRYSGKDGLLFRSERFDEVLVKPGETGTLAFVTQADFEISVYKNGEDKKLYAIRVKVK